MDASRRLGCKAIFLITFPLAPLMHVLDAPLERRISALIAPSCLVLRRSAVAELLNSDLFFFTPYDYYR